MRPHLLAFACSLVVGACGNGGGASDGPGGDAAGEASPADALDADGAGRDARAPVDATLPPDAGPIDEATLGAACTAQASALCDRLEACAPGYVARTWSDGADCRARARLGCLARVHVTDAYAPLDVAVDCTAQLRAGSCDALFARGVHGLDAFVDYPCPVIGGTRAPDAACIADAECASGYCAYRWKGCGVCRDAPGDGRAPADGYDCGPWLLLGADKACHAPKLTGEPCDEANHPCAWNLACVGGTCAKGGASGAACDATTGNRCDWTARLKCSGGTTGPGTCVDATFAAVGEPCDDLAPRAALEARVCAGGAVCLSHGTSAATCVARATDGAPCDPSARCTAPATCLAGACTIASDIDCR